ncbi:RnfABCDGE type electron transport complex subunit G [Robiginitalea sp. SC105]|uniref:RnfABCDGE type electron transport complex subunit G n=1 Tax=Robiginitalea sp. SC105 TaxID=2762332 RepID=UPI001639614D|nr:RnfABCDGE type electron transport complex subunit G [Robiginitalea sp. SC105]MBC2837885.1 RnfABCDGE type electron transport complex subunit G [Robiginitalea sp. SC105]
MTAQKKDSTLINMVLALFIITGAAGLSLGYVNELTRGPKAAAKLARKVQAVETVLPEFDNQPVSEVVRVMAGEPGDSTEIYPAYLQGEFVGAAVTGASEKGYNGLIRLLVGFHADGSMENIAVLEQKETPGLGTKMKGERFLRQFRGKDPSEFELKAVKDGGDVDALTGATITTRAFSEAVQQACEAYRGYKESLPTEN